MIQIKGLEDFNNEMDRINGLKDDFIGQLTSEVKELNSLINNFIDMIEMTVIKEFIKIKINKIQKKEKKFINNIVHISEIDDDSVKCFIEKTKIEEPVRVFIERKINTDNFAFTPKKNHVTITVEKISKEIIGIDTM